MTIKLQEIFSSIQGEGMRVGEPSTFIRFTGCNLKCLDCDTKYSWKTAGTEMSIDFIVKEVKEKHYTNAFVITGGEPMLQQEALAQLVYALKDAFPNSNITIESNGSIRVDKDLPVFWSFSPKFESSTTCSHLADYKAAMKHNLEITKDRQIKLLMEVFRGSSSFTKLVSDINKNDYSDVDVVVQPLIEFGEDVDGLELDKMKKLYKSVLNKISEINGLTCKSIRFVGQIHKVFKVE